MRFSMLLLAATVGLAGCARGPSGGAVTPQANNILSVRMRLQQPLNPQYFYAFAFDDNGNAGDGPVALLSSTTAANGIVGGSFTVLVLYNGGQFNVYRRSFANNSETLQRVANPFSVPPLLPQIGQDIAFSLNLDATLPDGSRLFRGSNAGLPTSLDVNFITSNERRRDPNDLRIKTFDAFYQLTGGRWLTIRNTDSPRVISNADARLEPAGDVISGDTSNQVNTAALDITDFRIEIQRNQN